MTDIKNRWISLHGHSYYSLLDGISSPEKLVKRAANLNMAALTISDHGSIGGAIKHEKACKKAGIKPIRAVEFYIKDPEFEKSTHLVTIAKNLKGYKQLLKMVTLSNRHENFYRNPRLTREQFGELCDGNIVVLNGHCGSSMANILFTSIEKAYGAKTEEEVKSYLRPDAKKIAIKLAEEYIEMVGAENFYIEIQRQDERFKAGKVIAEVLREVAGGRFNKAATCDFHYSDKKDAEDQRVVLCKYLGKTLNEADKAAKADEDFSLGGFFKSEMYYMLSPEEMYEVHKGYDDEIANTALISDMVENYTLLGPPKVPLFPCPDDLHPDDYLKQICEENWHLIENSPIPQSVYKARIKYELDTLLPMNLSSYFLIVRDYIEKAKNDGSFVGKARGSAGGCLLSFLAGVTGIDPLPPDLKFERFFNAGRANAYPDIDIDFESWYRPKIFNYVSEKYDPDYTGNIVTFSRLQGRGALKIVLNAHGAASFNEQNEMSAPIPSDSAISDELEEMIQQGLEPSVIMWALEHRPKELSQWARLEDDGSISGEYGEYFAQAIRLEGVKVGQSKHPSGYLICSEKISDLAPIIRDKSSDRGMCGYDMNDANDVGLMKFDILSTAVLDKIHYTEQLLAKKYEE